MGVGDRLHRLRELPRLRVVQTLTAGYDDVLPHVGPGVELANAAGVHDTSTAELAVTLILAAQRGIPEFVAAQADSRWLSGPPRTALADKRVMVLGYGAIGRAIARRLLPFEVSVTAVASRPRAGDELVASVHGIDAGQRGTRWCRRHRCPRRGAARRSRPCGARRHRPRAAAAGAPPVARSP